MSATTLPTSSGSVDQRAAMSTGRAGCACQGNLCSSPPVYTVPHPLGGGRIRVSAQCKARLEGRESAWGPGEGYDPASDTARVQKAGAEQGMRTRLRKAWPQPGTCAAEILLSLSAGGPPRSPQHAAKTSRRALKALRQRSLVCKQQDRLTKRGERAAARLRSAS